MKLINKTIWNTRELKAILQRAAERELDPAHRRRLIVEVTYTRGGLSSGCAVIRGRHATVRIQHPFTRRETFIHVPMDDPRKGRGTSRITVCDNCGHNAHKFTAHSQTAPDADGNVLQSDWRRGVCEVCGCEEYVEKVLSEQKIVAVGKAKELTEDRLSEIKIAFAKVACHEFAHNRGMHHDQMPEHYKWRGNWRERFAWALDFPLTVAQPKAKPSMAETIQKRYESVVELERKWLSKLKAAQNKVKKLKARRSRYEKVYGAALQRPPK